MWAGPLLKRPFAVDCLTQEWGGKRLLQFVLPCGCCWVCCFVSCVSKQAGQDAAASMCVCTIQALARARCVRFGGVPLGSVVGGAGTAPCAVAARTLLCCVRPGGCSHSAAYLFARSSCMHRPGLDHGPPHTPCTLAARHRARRAEWRVYTDAPCACGTEACREHVPTAPGNQRMLHFGGLLSAVVPPASNPIELPAVGRGACCAPACWLQQRSAWPVACGASLFDLRPFVSALAVCLCCQRCAVSASSFTSVVASGLSDPQPFLTVFFPQAPDPGASHS